MATRAYMYKRPIMKKSFFKSTDYKGRWFILQDRTLSYYDGAAGGVPNNEKGKIYLETMRIVEKVEDDEEFYGKSNVFQIMFQSSLGKDHYVLYIVANCKEEQEVWVQNIRQAAINLGVKLYPKYHPKAFSHKRKCYNCCDGLGITNRGCKDSAYKQENIPTVPSDFQNNNHSLPPVPYNNNNNNKEYFSESSSKPRVIALYDYEPAQDGDLALVRGEHYDVVDNNEQHWWRAKDKYGQEGFIPANYVQVTTDMGLEQFDWYYKDITRNQCDELLRAQNREGIFLVKDSSTPGQYTLCVFSKEPSAPDGIVRYYHIKRDNEKKFYVSEKHSFDTISDLIQYHKTNAAGMTCRLRSPPGNRDSEQPATAGFAHDKWEIDPNELQLHEELGRGQFGTVRRATWKSTKGKPVIVAVKSLKEGSMNEDDFKEEAQTMKLLQHPNLVQLYGVCTRKKPLYIITEFMMHGALLKYLQRSKQKLQGKYPQLISICLQVCGAMEYLEMNKFIHRDLAARNCLVGQDYAVKVADFGLTRFVNDDEYTSGAGSKFPVKWAPPEVVSFMRFSSKSDVWAFGILMWEIWTFGETPYARMRNDEVVNAITTRNYRLEKPADCPLSVYHVMKSCWHKESSQRPTFSVLIDELNKLPENCSYEG